MPRDSLRKRSHSDRPSKDDVHRSNPAHTSGGTIKEKRRNAAETILDEEPDELRGIYETDIQPGGLPTDTGYVDEESAVHEAGQRPQQSLREANNSTLAPPISKRAKKLASIEGAVGTNDKPKGSITHDADGLLWWRANTASTWQLAVFHEDLRAELIAECAVLGTYVHPRNQGRHELDVTSFHKEHETWGLDRADRPGILFQIQPGDASALFDTGTNWYRNGRIILDGNNNPVKIFSEIPATCSSELEGFVIEAIQRANPNITVHDLLARMPHYRIRSSGEVQKQYTPSTIGMRALRFRERAGCISWINRSGSGKIYDYLMNLWPTDCKAANSTKAFRDLTPEETKGMKAVNKGMFPYLKVGRFSSASVSTDEKAELGSTALENLSISRSSRLESPSFKNLDDTSNKRKAGDDATSPIIKRTIQRDRNKKLRSGYWVPQNNELDYPKRPVLAPSVTETVFHRELDQRGPLEIGNTVEYGELPQKTYIDQASAIAPSRFSVSDQIFSAEDTQAIRRYHLGRVATGDDGSCNNAFDQEAAANGQSSHENILTYSELSRLGVPGYVHDSHDEASAVDDDL